MTTEDIAETHSLKVGIILIATILLPYSWTLIPESFIWGFPFFDNSIYKFSFSPVEYRTYAFRDIIPFYQFAFIGCVYTYCRGLVPQMHVQFLNKTIDIWFLYLLYLGLQGIDLFIAFLQFPHYRMLMTLIILTVHIKFLSKLRV